ncbi:MAG: hypothetical protein VB133_12590 [Anaeromusa sp.]|uniref:hypothetical protein n=1 Tax=Anaeromusa sp. TaxID=1872520 RepID=UPI002B2102BC|nr:hypothetical protein [Anaeromusa sp.]MEA4835963.1 hypothetical protein [Anaeromusa sp.]
MTKQSLRKSPMFFLWLFSDTFLVETGCYAIHGASGTRHFTCRRCVNRNPRYFSYLVEQEEVVMEAYEKIYQLQQLIEEKNGPARQVRTGWAWTWGRQMWCLS